MLALRPMMLLTAPAVLLAAMLVAVVHVVSPFVDPITTRAECLGPESHHVVRDFLELPAYLLITHLGASFRTLSVGVVAHRRVVARQPMPVGNTA
jgi:hypothetical protein